MDTRDTDNTKKNTSNTSESSGSGNVRNGSGGGEVEYSRLDISGEVRDAETLNLDRAVLVGAGEERYLEELSRLAETLGLRVCGVLEQARRDSSGYLGSGKRQELSTLIRNVDAGVILTDDELTASQARTIERECSVGVIDRTELIIRIFESHARDAASKLQIELAELQYLLPRVRGMWKHLERIGGGVGASGGGLGTSGGGATRGPGEQQLEYDRREIRSRIEKLKSRLANERQSRNVRRTRLKESTTPQVSLVGYTNAGKTTILNALTDATRSTKDRLFETLETTTRLVEGSRTESGSYTPDLTVTDTVGFIRKLPTQLVESFASTLEAASDSDILLLCADASSDDVQEEVATVKKTLGDIGLDLSQTPIIHVLNKADRISDRRREELSDSFVDAVFTSAILGKEGCVALEERIYDIISGMRKDMKVLIPHSDYGVATSLYGVAEIHEREETEAGVIMKISIPRSTSHNYEPYRIERKVKTSKEKTL